MRSSDREGIQRAETASQVTEMRPGAVQTTGGRQGGGNRGMEYVVGNQHLAREIL